MSPFAIALTLLVVTGVAERHQHHRRLQRPRLDVRADDGGVASPTSPSRSATRSSSRPALITAGAVLGFFVWNFPAGLIFLGDGGAYLHRLPARRAERPADRSATAGVSPMFPLLLCAYPIFETIFTMYRRKFVRGVPTAAARRHPPAHADPPPPDAPGRSAVNQERRQTRAQLDDVALPVGAVPDVGDPERAVVEQHARS